MSRGRVDSWVRRLGRLDSCAVSDALDRLGCDGALSGFRRFAGTGVLAGELLTVALERGPGPSGGSHLGTEALSGAGSGTVIVVANQGRTEAGAWGGLLTLHAKVRGVAGVIVDGGLRDADEVKVLGIPVFARATTPRTARGRFHEVGTAQTVKVEGVSVESGGLVIADGTGVAFVARGREEEVLSLAEEIAAAEERMADALRTGGAGHAVLDSRYERMLDR